MKLSVIIVSYNVRYYLEQCINSVLKATQRKDTEIFVVDNNSSDDTVAYLGARFNNDIHIIANDDNIGFAKANNMAIKQAKGEYVLLLNPDTFVTEDSLKQVLQFMDIHPKAGATGVLMHNFDGSYALESRRALPTPYVSFLKMLGLSHRYYMSHLPWDKPCRIEVLSGAFCLLRRSVLDEIGMLDEDFFMYGEDIDLSYRITKQGYENWYFPASILHYKGESTHKQTFSYVNVFYQAMLIFFRKHYANLSFLLTIPVKLAIYMFAAIAFFQVQFYRLKSLLGLNRSAINDYEYFFVGSDEMLAECRQLAKRNKLRANFLSRLEDVSGCDACIVVYDTKNYSYGDILEDAHSHKGRFIGTYNTDSHTLITPLQVIV